MKCNAAFEQYALGAYSISTTSPLWLRTMNRRRSAVRPCY